ncbi:MAG: efflux transporter periplasmic adaptor subunit [Pseudopedobacter saltans]|uniref:Efflux transporter periplasmic adaptor subunit n=1 Tax=Pseudopedobacter saltans TaxID=151895 RepID=A0A2W5F4F0_9SPHI|nr:MAG: efflux transporter periplasmic adaptor subunit [Pseudopedobacter saltans]
MKNILIYIVFASCFISCKSNSNTDNVEKKPSDPNVVVFNDTQLKNEGVTIGYPTMRNISSQIQVSGTVDVPPTNLVSVSFPFGGYVKSIHLLPGMKVQKGEKIATLEDQSYVQVQQDYLTAKAQLNYLQTDLARQKKLSQNDAATIKNYQLILSQYQAQEAILKSLEQKLQILHISPKNLHAGSLTVDIPVYAPISGFVSQVNVNLGQYVNPSDILFSLINPSDLHAAMAVFEKDLPLFKPGMTGVVYLNDDTTKLYPVEVILVAKDVDSIGKALVHCHFEKELPHMAPGMFLNGRFAIGGGTSVSVPDDAVVRYFGKDYIFTTDDGHKFYMQEVQTGNSENGYTALLPNKNIDYLHTKIAINGAYSLIGALKNPMEDDD